MKPRPPVSLLLGALLATGLAWADDAPLPVRIGADDASIRYIGHFDRQDAAGPKCSWSACTATLRVNGADVNVRLSEGGGKIQGQQGVNQWQVVIDGQPAKILKPVQGEGLYRIASGLPPGEHLIELVRRTEGSLGVSQLLGFELSAGGRLLEPRPKRRHIETIGASIMCGYGVEATDPEERFSIDTENANLSVGAVAARAVQADFSSLCKSGMTLQGARNLFMSESLMHGAPDVDFFSITPDAVLINLGTNDFAKGNPPQRTWTDAFKQLVARVRAFYPNAMIYISSSPVLTDLWPEGQIAWSTHATYMRELASALGQAGDARVRYIEFPSQLRMNGIGADYHPSIKTQELMAQTWVKALQKDLGW
ncbi:MAG: GDSL family lipase [Halothiobacillaceae bacterium]|nr:MAG: GDSL family lipase [Halothiobacillaceae bacterium]